LHLIDTRLSCLVPLLEKSQARQLPWKVYSEQKSESTQIVPPAHIVRTRQLYRIVHRLLKTVEQTLAKQNAATRWPVLEIQETTEVENMTWNLSNLFHETYVNLATFLKDQKKKSVEPPSGSFPSSPFVSSVAAQKRLQVT
jgi:hypothetical protein